jgi:hypothetical protein
MHNVPINPLPIDGAQSTIRFGLTYRQFRLPPVGDGLLIGRRASIGSTGMYEAMERMLPGMYELVPVDSPTVEAIIILRSQFRLLGREQLVAMLLKHGESLMDPAGCLQVEVSGDVSVSLEVERSG